MTAWLVTGVDDPHWVANIADNAARQTAPDVRLVAVLNGDGACADLSPLRRLDPVVTESARGCAEYINAGLARVRLLARPGDLFLKFDADDYYGPRYVERALAAAAPRVAVCQTDIFVCTPGGEMWSLAWPDGIVGVRHGPTLGCLVGDALDFPASPSDWGEDGLWTAAMLASGVAFRSVPRGHFCYMRHADRRHAFPVTGDGLRHIWGPADVRAIGPWDEPVINGELPAPSGVPIPFDPRGLADVADALLSAATTRAA